jgi:hypothetical protein
MGFGEQQDSSGHYSSYRPKSSQFLSILPFQMVHPTGLINLVLINLYLFG